MKAIKKNVKQQSCLTFPTTDVKRETNELAVIPNSEDKKILLGYISLADSVNSRPCDCTACNSCRCTPCK